MNNRQLRFGALLSATVVIVACGGTNEAPNTSDSAGLAPATPSMAPGMMMDSSMLMDTSLRTDSLTDTTRRDTTLRDTTRP